MAEDLCTGKVSAEEWLQKKKNTEANAGTYHPFKGSTNKSSPAQQSYLFTGTARHISDTLLNNASGIERKQAQFTPL